MKKGKIIAIIIAIVAVLAIVTILLIMGTKSVVSDIEQEELIKKELKEINEMSDAENIDKEALDKKINNIATTGDYAIVEKALKTYISDVYRDTTKLSELLTDKKLEDIMTTNNYKNDGPDFIETKEYLTNEKNQIKEYKDIVYGYFEEEKIMSYINDKGLDSYYMDLYKQLALEDREQLEQEDKNKIDESIDLIYNIIDVGNETIDFLIQNKGKWEVQGEEIAFETDVLSTQYTNIINKLN